MKLESESVVYHQKKLLMSACVEASVINLFQLIHFRHKIILGGVQLRATLFVSLNL